MRQKKYTICWVHGSIYNTETETGEGTLEHLAKKFSEHHDENKYSSYFLRGLADKRNDQSMTTVDWIIIDGDGSLKDPHSAPDPNQVHEILKKSKINHFLYPSYSNSEGKIRWRVVIPASNLTLKNWKNGVDHITHIIQSGGAQIRPVKENYTLSQAWFITGPLDEQYRYKSLIYNKNKNDYSWDGLKYTISGTKISKGRKSKKTHSRPQENISKKQAKRNIEYGIDLHPSVLSLARKGYSKEKIIGLIEDGATLAVRGEKRFESLIGTEIDDIFKWFLATDSDKPKTQKQFELLSINDLLTDIKETDWLIEGILENNALSVVFGEPGSYKSFLAIDWGLCVATGTPWLERQVDSGLVIFIIGEGQNGLRKRVQAWEKEKNVSLGKAPVVFSSIPAQILDEKSAKLVAAEINKSIKVHGKPKLLILDTLARNFGDGDENSTKDMTKFISMLDKHIGSDFTRIIIHHTGLSDKKRARGSSVLRAAADSEYMMTKAGIGVKLECTKMKDEEPFSSISLRTKLVTVNELASSLVLERSEILLALQKQKPIDEMRVTIRSAGKIKVAELLKQTERFGYKNVSSCDTNIKKMMKNTKEFSYTKNNTAIKVKK